MKSGNSSELCEALFRIAMDVRTFLEPVWPAWRQQGGRPHAKPPSWGTCGRSSLFLRDALRFEGYKAEWTVGNPGQSKGDGQTDASGFFTGLAWQSHAWVSFEGVIIDVTADQFGADPVIVTSEFDTRYRADNIDAAYPSAIEARHAAVAALWPTWLRRRHAGNAP